MTVWKYKIQFSKGHIFISKRWDDKELLKGSWTTTEDELVRELRLDDEIGL